MANGHPTILRFDYTYSDGDYEVRKWGSLDGHAVQLVLHYPSGDKTQKPVYWLGVGCRRFQKAEDCYRHYQFSEASYPPGEPRSISSRMHRPDIPLAMNMAREEFKKLGLDW